MAWFISDHHFNHSKVIEYCKRDFNNVEEMNKHMINKWNKVVKEGDTVYHLGDFIFNPKREETFELINLLNRSITLVKGNHDRKTVTWYKSVGIKEVLTGPVSIDGYILSHAPVDVEKIPTGVVNIHGHIHNKLIKEYLTEEYLNVSADVLNYTSIWIDLK